MAEPIALEASGGGDRVVAVVLDEDEDRDLVIEVTVFENQHGDAKRVLLSRLDALRLAAYVSAHCGDGRVVASA